MLQKCHITGENTSVDVSARALFRRQIEHLVTQHVVALQAYITIPEPDSILIPNSVLFALDCVADLSMKPLEDTSLADLKTAYGCLHTVREFLCIFNQNIDNAFLQTDIGQLVSSAQEWFVTVRTHLLDLSTAAVWDFIDPARPDSMICRRDFVYEAIWWPPVPMMDIEILRGTEGIEVHGEPYTPGNAPGGLAVQFSIFPIL